MQRSTRPLSLSWFQALKKSACMEEEGPEESLTLPDGLGSSKVTFIVSTGTDLGWERGHCNLSLMRLL